MMRILLNGFDGRLGSEIMNVAKDGKVPVEPLTRKESEECSLLEERLATAAVVCDVTIPAGTRSLCRSLLALTPVAQSRCLALVIGVTGHTAEDREIIKTIAERIPVVMVPNFSRGIFLFEQLLAAKTPLGPSVAELARSLGFDLALWESHHTRKLDAPSGTAKALAERAQIPPDRIASTRVGQVVGEHTLFVAGDGEELRITHTAHTRRLLAAGAVDLCQRVFNHPPEMGVWDRERFYR